MDRFYEPDLSAIRKGLLDGRSLVMVMTKGIGANLATMKREHIHAALCPS